MKRSILLQSAALAAVLALSAGVPAFAAGDAPKADAPRGAATTTMQGPADIDAKAMIGQSVRNAEGDKIGDINSVILGKDGKAAAVIVGVGGFLGMGEHDVALDWNALQIADQGRTVTANFTKDQLRAMPEYKFAEASWRGTAYEDPNWRPTAPAAPATGGTRR